MSTEVLKSRINLLEQVIKVKEVNPDDFANANHVIFVNNFIPSIVDEIKKGQSIENWIKYEIEKIEKSDEDKLYQYNVLGMVAQFYVSENKGNPNNILKLINKWKEKKHLNRLDMGEIIANDPRTLVIDGQLMVKNNKGVYTDRKSVV